MKIKQTIYGLVAGIILASIPTPARAESVNLRVLAAAAVAACTGAYGLYKLAGYCFGKRTDAFTSSTKMLNKTVHINALPAGQHYNRSCTLMYRNGVNQTMVTVQAYVAEPNNDIEKQFKNRVWEIMQSEPGALRS